MLTSLQFYLLGKNASLLDVHSSWNAVFVSSQLKSGSLVARSSIYDAGNIWSDLYCVSAESLTKKPNQKKNSLACVYKMAKELNMAHFSNYMHHAGCFLL